MTAKYPLLPYPGIHGYTAEQLYQFAVAAREGWLSPEEAEKLRTERDHLKMQATCHAQEARTHSSVINEIYQLCTGAAGEPGNWNGAAPVRKLIDETEKLRKDAARLDWLGAWAPQQVLIKKAGFSFYIRVGNFGTGGPKTIREAVDAAMEASK